MSYNALVKSDSESLLVGVDFAAQVVDGQSIIASNSKGTTTVEVLNAAGAAVASMVESGSVSISGTTVSARVEAGTARTQYRISFLAATSDGNYLEMKIPLYVVD